jgi:hypothetical protein
MIYTAIALFSVAAMLGLYLLTLVLQKKETPKAIAIFHGLFAASALVLLIFYTLKTGSNFYLSITLFVIAALGGLVLFTRDITGKPLPKALAILHGLLAVSGFVVLLICVFIVK